MEIVALSIGIVGGALVFLAPWGLYCNRKTYKQRRELIAAVHMSFRDWEYYSSLFNDISYEQHMFALMTFRNPYKLYGPDIRLRLVRYQLQGDQRPKELQQVYEKGKEVLND